MCKKWLSYTHVFLINDDKLLEKSNKIWDEVSNIIKELDTEKI